MLELVRSRPFAPCASGMERQVAVVGIPIAFHPGVPQFIRDRLEIFIVTVSWGHMFFDFGDLLRLHETANHMAMAVTLALDAIDGANQ